MFHDFDEFGRRRHGRQTQTIDVPRRNGTSRQPHTVREANWQLQQELKQVQVELAQARARIRDLEAEREATAVQTTDSSEGQEKELQLQAEFEASKKRLAFRYAAEAEQQKEKVLRDMLPLADNLERALLHTAETDDDAGMALTLRAFTAVLSQYGVQPIEAEGKLFDPQLHDATGVVIDPKKEPGTVVKVEEKGYMYNNKLLRPARVLVVAR